MLYFKTIPLQPSPFELCVIVCDDVDQTVGFLSELVGFSKEYHLESDADGDWVATFAEPQKGSKMEGTKTILMKLNNLKDKAIMVHELTHVLFAMSDLAHMEVKSESQEWIALFMERTWEELCKPTYEKIKK